MIDQRLDEHVRAVLADEPPLGFDPDEVADRAGRRQRHRRAMAGTGLAVAAVAVAAAAVFGTGGGAPGKDVGVADSPAPAPAPGAAVCPEDPAAVLEPIVAGLLAEHVPGGQFDPPAIVVSIGEDGEDCLVDVTSPFTGAGPNTGVGVMLASPGSVGEQPDELVSETPQPDGSVVRVYQRTSPSNPDDHVRIVVVHVRADGWIARATSTDATVASADQLTAIVTDSRLTF